MIRIKRFAVFITIISVIAAILSCAMAVSIGFYTFHKLNEVDELKEANIEKRLACAILEAKVEATISSRGHSHDYKK